MTGRFQAQKAVDRASGGIRKRRGCRLIGHPMSFLNQNGAFLVTKSGDKIAKYFGISKYTLYSYIDTKQQEGK